MIADVLFIEGRPHHALAMARLQEAVRVTGFDLVVREVRVTSAVEAKEMRASVARRTSTGTVQTCFRPLRSMTWPAAGTPPASEMRQPPACRNQDATVTRSQSQRAPAPAQRASSNVFSLSKSLVLARCIARPRTGAATFEKPVGSPRLRRDIRVPPDSVSDHE